MGVFLRFEAKDNRSLSLIATRVTFEDNIAINHITGALLSFTDWKNITFDSCTFSRNIGLDSGVMIFYAEEGPDTPHYGSLTIKNCTFDRNGSTQGSGAVRIYGGTEPEILLEILIEGNTFINNAGWEETLTIYNRNDDGFDDVGDPDGKWYETKINGPLLKVKYIKMKNNKFQNNTVFEGGAVSIRLYANIEFTDNNVFDGNSDEHDFNTIVVQEWIDRGNYLLAPFDYNSSNAVRNAKSIIDLENTFHNEFHDLTISNNTCGFHDTIFSSTNYSAGLFMYKPRGTLTTSNIVIDGNTRRYGVASGFYFIFEYPHNDNFAEPYTFNGFNFKNNNSTDNCTYGAMVIKQDFSNEAKDFTMQITNSEFTGNEAP